jgi:hypothetical protein
VKKLLYLYFVSCFFISVKLRVRVVHCHALPSSSCLSIPLCGMGETLVVPLVPLHQGLALAARLEQLVVESKIFNSLTGGALQQFMSRKQLVLFKKGDSLIRKGEHDDDRVLMIVDGVCVVRASTPAISQSSESISNDKDTVEAGSLLLPDWPPASDM